MNQATSQDHLLAKASHGKPDASKTRMHGRLDMHGYNKAHDCLPSDAGTEAMPNTCACGIDDTATIP